MIDLEKERELFKSAMISSEIHQEEFEIDEYGNFSWIGTDEAFETWLERANLAKAEQEKLEEEIKSLKSQLEAKNNAIIFADECRQEWCEFAMRKNKALQEVKAQLAQYQSDDYVSIKKDTKTVVAIENMVDQQVEASGIDEPIHRLDGWLILEAMIEAQEQHNEQM